MTSHASLLRRLMPPVSYDTTAPNLGADLSAEGAALDVAQSALSMIPEAAIPSAASVQFLPDWEQLLAIVPSADATLQQRVAIVIAKLNETGGLSIPYFVQLAASLGFTVRIEEPQPFRVGVNRCGDAIYIRDIIFVWRVLVDGSPEISYRFRVGRSATGERLLSFSTPVLEDLFRDLKPAHTYVSFLYHED